ncbi:MAG: sugar kinase [Proteobacteria bacterium]|nr:sugar kinase [Pseudomonadota bacterium]
MPRRFICAGSLNVDITFDVERIPREHEKLRCDSALVAPGGSAANTAHWLARLGLETSMLGGVGIDPFGPWCLDALDAAGVDTSRVQRHAGACTGMATIFINPTSKRMVTAGGANRCFDPEQVPAALFDRQTHLHFATSFRSIALPLLRKAKAAGAATSCDLDGLPTSEMLPLLDYCFVNQTDLQRALGSVDTHAAWKSLGSRMTLVVTLGERGAVAIDGQGEHSASAFPAYVVDRTGGGDAFDAGFLYGLACGHDLSVCLRLGLQLAARVISAPGARPNTVALDDLGGPVTPGINGLTSNGVTLTKTGQ